MTDVILQFLKAGMFTTVQDAGRNGCQSKGVPVGGAMDKTAMQVANWLVGNDLNNPVFEMTLMGPVIEVQGDCLVAFAGADMTPKIDGQEVPLNQTIQIEKNTNISFGQLKSGCRCYMAVSGEWQMNKWLGSYSATNFKNEIVNDSLIKKGAIVKIKSNLKSTGNKLKTASVFPFNKNVIRVLAGPEFELFNRQYIARFFSQQFRVSVDSNRMGYRLESDLELTQKLIPLISSGVYPGTIQISNDGQPIVLMADAQTTGGYPRFANIISADMDLMAPLKPGDKFRFSLVSLKEALTVKKEKELFYSFLKI